MSYRDALKQTKVTSGAAGKPVANVAVQVPTKPIDECGEQSMVERKSVEMQTDAPQQNAWQTSHLTLACLESRQV